MQTSDIKEALDEVRTDLKEVIRTQVRHNTLLDEHMRRTAANEENLQLLRDEFAPMKTHLALWGAAGKVVTFIGVAVGIATGVVKLMGH